MARLLLRAEFLGTVSFCWRVVAPYTGAEVYVGGLMNFHKFHLELLGRMASETPKEFYLDTLQEAFYADAFTKGVRGFNTKQLHPSLFLATCVVALRLTEGLYPVYFVVPKPHVRWVLDQMEGIGRHVFRHRKNNKEAVMALRQAFAQLRMTPRFETTEPSRWVMFGFNDEDLLPEWAKGRLMEFQELPAPRSAGART